MASRQLEYIVSLRDQLTPEISKISREMDRLGGQGQKAIGRIALGAAGLYGIGASVMSGLQPAIEMNNELGKIKGLGESAEGLELLQKRALSFSTQWGESAAEFVDASYDIKSAIDGLSAEELVSFTEISAVTGKATQTSGKIMTDYLGTMYSVLGASKEADKISWAKTLMAQTAYTANKFKSDGAKIAQSFKTLGNTAVEAGFKISEQFATLGLLHNEMDAGVAATKYRAFIMNAGKAGRKLGLQFTDSNNRLLSLPDILDKIKGKFGDLIDDKEAQLIGKAFGTTEAIGLVTTLIGKTDELRKSEKELAAQNGLGEVLEGARANIDVFKRLQEVVKGIKIAIGDQLLKVLDPFLQKIADVGSYLVDWFTANKYIARLVGLVLGGVAAVAALASAVTLLTGLFALVKVGIVIFGALAVPVAILALKIGAVMGLIYLFRSQIVKFVSGFMAGLNGVSIALEPIKQAFGELFTRIGQIAARLSGSGEAWNGWAALGRVAGGLLAIVLNTIITGLEFIINIASTVLDVFVDVFDGISYTWQTVSEAFTNEGIFAAFEALGDGVTKMFTNIMESILRGIINMINTAIGWVNKLGANIDPIELPVRLRTNDINATTSTAGITGTVLNLAQSATNNTLKVEGTNAKALTQPKSGKGAAGQITQNKTAHIVNHINIHGADAGTQANNYVNAQERAQLGA